jgi:hypothetical protein
LGDDDEASLGHFVPRERWLLFANTVIARDLSAVARRAKAEAIQTFSAAAFWIASLRSQ